MDSEAGNPDGRNFAILASGTGSQVDLSALTSILDRSSSGLGITGTSSLQADGGGQIVVPLLASLSATDLVMSSPISLPSLTSFTQATIAVNGINVVMPTLTSIDGVNLSVTAGGSLAFPNVTTYTNTNAGTFNSWTVSGSGSLLDLQNITTITSSSSHIKQHSISASSGGRIDLHRVTTFVDSEAGNPNGRNFAILASGTGSVVDLSALTAILDRSPSGFGIGGLSSLIAHGGGVLLVPRLTSILSTEIEVDATGVLSVPALQSMIDGNVRVTDRDFTFPILTMLSNTGLDTIGTAHIIFPVLQEVNITNQSYDAEVVIPNLNRITISGGKLAIQMPPALLSVDMRGGEIAVNADTEIRESFVWTGGKLIGNKSLTLAPGVDGKIGGVTAKVLATQLINDSSLTYDGSSLAFGEGTTAGLLTNLANRSLVMIGDGDIAAATSNAAHRINNFGTWQRYGSGNTKIDVSVENSGNLAIQQGAFDIGNSQNFAVTVNGTVSTLAAARLSVAGNLTASTPSYDRWSTAGITRLDGTSLQKLEVMSTNLGANTSGFNENFSHRVLEILGSNVRLVDEANNAPGAGSEVVYVDSLRVGNGASLDLNGLTLYARSISNEGQIVGGSVVLIPDGGSLSLNSPVFGSISAPGEIDNWDFLGRVGQRVKLTVNPGGTTEPAAPAPSLGLATIELVNPSGTVIATATSAGVGGPATIEIPALNVDGNYRIVVRAPDAEANRTGNYILTGIDAKLDNYPLVLNETMTGLIESPASVDRWTFSAAANQQVRLQIQNSSFVGLRFKLTGTNGFVGFSNLETDSELLTLPETGTYQIEVESAVGGFGSYAFKLIPSQETLLTLGTPFPGSVQGEGFAQLFRFNVPQNNPLSVLLTSPAASDIEVYLSRGTAPTRQQFNYQSSAFGQTQSLVVPIAGAGTWYALVYTRAVAATTPFNLLVDAVPLIVQSTSPSKMARNVPLNLQIQGGGFLVGTQVFLDKAGVEQLAASSVSIDASTQMIAHFDLSSLPVGQMDVRVRLPDGTQRTLPGAFEVLAPGTAKLETRLIMPSALGRGASATLYLEYANTGVVAMPAPLLTVRSADPDDSDKPRLSLDTSNLASSFWTSARPDGVSSIVQIYASGLTSGLLQPGERIQVPITYLGLTQPFDFSDTQVEMEVLVTSAEESAPINWSAFDSFLKPSWMSPEVWAIVFQTLQSRVGSTWGDYVRMLSDNASYLSRLGQRLSNASQLLNYELSQAIGYSPVSSIGSAIDMEVLTPGDDIQFGRTYATSLAQRFEIGPFGRGWMADWQTKQTFENGGIVVISNAAGLQRRFQPDIRRSGTYFSSADDTGTLTQLASFDFQLTETDGSSQTFSPDGKLKFQTDSYGNRVSTTYVGNRLTRLTHSSGSFIDIVYNAAGRIISMTDSSGRTASYTYDATNEYLLSVATAIGTVNYTYDSTSTDGRRHSLTSITDPTGVPLVYTWDVFGRMISSSVGSGPGVGRLDFSYDDAGTVTTTSTTGESTQVWFDHRGQVARRILPSGQYFNYSYDSGRRLVKISDATGRVQSYAYNRKGALVSQTDPNGNVTTFLTSSSSVLPRVLLDANGSRTVYDYNFAGDVIAKTMADGTIERSTFDALGNLVQLQNRRGQSLNRTYNTAGQVIREQMSDGTANVFTYDSRNRLATATGTAGTTTYTYNAQDLLARVDYPNGRWIDYLYDAAGRRLRLSTSAGAATNYVYDSFGRLTELRDQANTLVVRYSYDALNRVIREDKGNGTYTLTNYDSGGRISSIISHAANNAIQNQFLYTYNLLDQRLTTQTLDGTWTYAYDSSSQLIRAEFVSSNPSISNQLYQYQYDKLGNRTQTIINGMTTNATANNLNQIGSLGTTNYEYDADGNLVRIEAPDGVSFLQYDTRNQLTSVTSPTGTWTYQYDASGYRSASTVNGVRTEYLIDYSNAFHVVAEFNAAGSMVASYTFGLGLEAVDQGGSRYFYDFDAIGSTSILTNSAGNVVNRYVYAPFGDTLFQSVAVANPFTFVGQFGVSSESNGLKFMQARYYASAIGQFISEDPLDLAGGDINVRRYVGNEVTSQVDPEGTFAIDLSRAKNGRLPSLPRIPTSAAFPNNNRTSNLVTRIVGNQAQQSSQISLNNQTRNSRRSFTKPRSADQVSKIMTTNALSYQGNEPQETVQPKSNFLSDLFFGDAISVLGDRSNTEVAQSIDPNEKLGAAGFGPQSFIAPSVEIPYRINFENLGPGSDPVPLRPATAPAQRVEIIDQLSPLLDWSTFSFSEFGFGDTVVELEGKSKFAYSTLPVTFGDRSFDLQVEMDFNPVTGFVRVIFQSVDPLTELPPDVQTGFLPPEDGTGRGQGFIGYSIRPKSDLTTGTELRNIATIIFDGQNAIATNQRDPQDPSAGTDPAREALNTIDAGAPSSSVTGLTSIISQTSFLVSWSGTDDADGSGISSYDIFVSIDGNPYQAWLTNTTSTSATYIGSTGHSYAFYSVAEDNVGNVEVAPSTSDAQTWISDLLLSSSSINENRAIGSLVGNLQTPLPAGVTATYQLVVGAGSDDNASFVIVGDQLQEASKFDFEAKSSYSIRVRTTTNTGIVFEKSFVIAVNDLAEVATIQVNSGAIQRSLVREVVVSFDGLVDIQDLNSGDFSSRPFQVRKRGVGGGLVETIATPTTVAGKTVITLRFAGAFIEAQGSLVDGNYDLVINSSKINRNGKLLDGNQDGIEGGDAYLGRDAQNNVLATDKFFRLLGDSDGDGVVSNFDLAGFNAAYRTRTGDARYNAAFDFDLSGVIDNRDLLRMNQQYRKRITFR
ncbi:MAG: RHS repeat-associated core domain-containing protein [Pirellulaceae bacterium]|nr:RHS repeat-associated core domain-containing protein [Pirellulaceae bacterium]